MYTIRVDSAQQILRIEMSGRVTTGEALRALSQAMALVDASRLASVSCDVSEVTRGPGGLLMLAAVFSSRYRYPTRVAFVGAAAQVRFVQRFINFTGHAYAMGFFTPVENADGWLVEAPKQPGAVRLASTVERHARILLGSNESPEAILAGLSRQEGAA